MEEIVDDIILEEGKTFSVKLLWVTPNSQQVVLYTARVSAENRNSENTKLLGYLIRNKHFSPFEMASMSVEITASRAVIRQILRHRSFNFQEFSQRYAVVKEEDMIVNEARRVDTKNRQNSIDDLPADVKKEWIDKQRSINKKVLETYQWAIEKGIAKECARSILCEGNTLSTLCMSGTLRSWIHYLQLRTSNGTQLEHMEVASECLRIFKEQFPIIYDAAFKDLNLISS
jgi:thymidylate synthase (FAD)